LWLLVEPIRFLRFLGEGTNEEDSELEVAEAEVRLTAVARTRRR
jgi:hypothetical protein